LRGGISVPAALKALREPEFWYGRIPGYLRKVNTVIGIEKQGIAGTKKCWLF